MNKGNKNMSYDVFYECPGLDRTNWRNSRQVGPDDREAFEIKIQELYERGNFVTLSAGRNFAFDEIFLFDRAEDAAEFFADGYQGYESVIDGSRCGFQEVTLYESGRKVASKSDDPDETVEGEVRQ
jgi:hypothetical protein